MTSDPDTKAHELAERAKKIQSEEKANTKQPVQVATDTQPSSHDTQQKETAQPHRDDTKQWIESQGLLKTVDYGDYNGYQPPQGHGGGDSGWANAGEPSAWYNESTAGPEGNWPSAVYDPYNPQGSNVAEGSSYADEPSADWGSYDREYTEHTFATRAPRKEEGIHTEEDSAIDAQVEKVIVTGATFSKEHPKKEDKRTESIVVARHVNPVRDEKVGVLLSQYNLNYVFADPDERDHKFRDLFGAPDPHYLPKTSDLRPNWGEILDQLDLGSCVANTVSYCIRYCFRKQKMGEFTPSRLFIYYNGRSLAGYPINEDTGLTIRDGYKSVSRHSVCSEDNWPYVISRFAQRPPDRCYAAAKAHQTFRYIYLDNSETQIKKCLKDGYPVSFGAALFDSFMSTSVARTGIVPMPGRRDQRIGGHAMTIIGHDDTKKAFLVVNNWGSTWGIGGCCWMPYAYITNDELVGDLWSPRWFGA